ncbi:MAG: hypothetical protein H7Z42_11545 [Roseiflexaceae bacterium]|nr:hypothetical protein [Roseiflexaceae bacterium]
MPLEMTLLFAVVAAMLIGVIVGLRRYWDAVSSRSDEEEDFDRRVKALNERQSNRMSDDLIRADMDEDSAWQIMVERGRRAARRKRPRSSERRRPR